MLVSDASAYSHACLLPSCRDDAMWQGLAAASAAAISATGSKHSAAGRPAASSRISAAGSSHAHGLLALSALCTAWGGAWSTAVRSVKDQPDHSRVVHEQEDARMEQIMQMQLHARGGKAAGHSGKSRAGWDAQLAPTMIAPPSDAPQVLYALSLTCAMRLRALCLDITASVHAHGMPATYVQHAPMRLQHLADATSAVTHLLKLTTAQHMAAHHKPTQRTSQHRLQQQLTALLPSLTQAVAGAVLAVAGQEDFTRHARLNAQLAHMRSHLTHGSVGKAGSDTGRAGRTVGGGTSALLMRESAAVRRRMVHALQALLQVHEVDHVSTAAAAIAALQR